MSYGPSLSPVEGPLPDLLWLAPIPVQLDVRLSGDATRAPHDASSKQCSLFVAHRIYRFERSGAHRGVQAKDETNEQRHDKAERDGKW